MMKHFEKKEIPKRNIGQKERPESKCGRSGDLSHVACEQREAIALSQTVVDLHCDTLTKCYTRGKGISENGFAFSLDKIPKDMRLCQVMAIFMPDGVRGEFAENYFNAIYKIFNNILTNYENAVNIIDDISTIKDNLNDKPVAVMLTVEGGSALNGKIENIRRMYDMGVRMMTLTWNAENELCGGWITDKGFTPFGRAAVAEMERLGMVVDVSHLSDKGFYELCDFAGKPFAASHSNSRTICGHKRNLTDDMFKKIVERKGIVGINYYDLFIVPGGGSKTIDDLIRHIHHFLELSGEDTIALGSDYDGAYIPPYLDSVEKILFLFDSMERSGIPSNIIQKILHENAVGFFSRMSSNE